MIALVFCVSLLPGCAWFGADTDKDNNHKTIPDMIRYFESSGLRMEKVVLVRRDVVNADDAVAITIDKRDIGIYKFNSKLTKQKERLASIKEKGCMYMVGIKKKALLNGTFVLVGSDDHPQRVVIEKVFMEFK